jgi:hypothetical protein
MSTLIHRFRAAAVFCAFAMLVCELISKPFTTMGICDDGPYILMARTFAQSGHIVYNGWAATMLVSQIYLAQPFIKLFGYSFTTVRMATLLVAVMTAFIFQRLLVRTGASERNATLGTLALVLSPIYLMLAGTFMSDIYGLFAIVLCLYGCVRAIRASADRSAIAWIFFALFTCAVLGTSRQTAWLGDLVMVPSTLWLLRSRGRVLLAGAVATAVAFLFIFGCMHWLSHQPYVVPVPLFVRPFAKRLALRELSYIVFEMFLMILPVVAVFFPRMFRSRAYIRSLFLVVLLAYILIALHSRKAPNPIVKFLPAGGYSGSWINVNGLYTSLGGAPVVLHTSTLIVLTTLCLGGLLGVIAVGLQARGATPPLLAANDLSWKQLGILLVPFSVAYLMSLAAATGTTHAIYDRYAIGLLGPAIIVLVRLYQERVQPRLPLATVVLIIVMGACGIIVTHNTFALDRARVDLADELHANGVPSTSIDGGWEYNFDTELANSDHLNDPRIKVPADAYVSPPPSPPGYCQAFWHDRTPHIHAVYGVSFSPDTCYGRAPFAPVQYRPWPLRIPVKLYAVRYAPPPR